MNTVLKIKIINVEVGLCLTLICTYILYSYPIAAVADEAVGERFLAGNFLAAARGMTGLRPPSSDLWAVARSTGGRQKRVYN